jgi:CelD/BcsL family acetyltransferase involved in cellulose biosynthesis
MQIHTYSSFDVLPGAYSTLFEAGARQSFFLSLEWFRTLEKTTLQPGEKLVLLGLESGDGDRPPLALLACKSAARSADERAAGWLSSFTNFHSLEFAPLIAPHAVHHAESLASIVTAIAEARPRWPGVRLDALDPSAPFFEEMLRLFRSNGFAAFPVFQFGNWHQDVTGRRFSDYFSTLSKSAQRRSRKFDRSENMTFQLVDDPDEIESAIGHYQSVYDGSWKEPERFPHFIPDLLRMAARRGNLRLGLLHVDGQPVAAEICLLANERSISVKSGYIEKFRKIGPGSILTVKMIEHLMEVDRIREIDFGSGDESYKQEWMSSRRERWGIIAFNLRTVEGISGAAQHIGGLTVKHMVGRLKTRPGSFRSSKA